MVILFSPIFLSFFLVKNVNNFYFNNFLNIYLKNTYLTK